MAFLTTRTATMQPRLLSADRIQRMPPMTSHEPDATPPPPALLTTAPAIEALLPAALALTAISRDRSLGVMYGLAVGNVLGIPVEFWTAAEIDRAYPGGVFDVDPAEAQLPPDDDLAQAMTVAEALIDGLLPPVEALAALLQEWLVENGRGAGRTTTEAIGFLQAGAGPIEAGMVAYAAGRRDPNGGLMRSPPVAIARRGSPGILIRDSAALCAVTHYGPLCQWSCCVVNAVIAQLLAGTTPDLSRLASAVVADRGPLDVAESIATVTRGASPRALNAASEHRGHTLLTMQMGLWAALTPLSFEDALVKVVSAGGDTDTNGAVAGAVLGARYGAAAIPARWLVGVPQLDTVAELAHALHDLSAAPATP